MLGIYWSNLAILTGCAMAAEYFHRLLHAMVFWCPGSSRAFKMVDLLGNIIAMLCVAWVDEEL